MASEYEKTRLKNLEENKRFLAELGIKQQQALELLERLQKKLHDGNDASHREDLSTLIYTLDSPLFSQILSIQDSIEQLKQVQYTRPVGPDDFDFDPITGELILNQLCSEDDAVPHGSYDTNHVSVLQESVTPVEVEAPPQEVDLNEEIKLAAQDREVHFIQLYKADNGSLGFSVVGLRSENKGELGIFVQKIQPGSIAEQDGRLQEGDQILAIDSQLLGSGISHGEAISILQKARGEVEVVVARGKTTTDISQSSPVDSSPPQIQEGSDMLSTDWVQLEVIELINDGTGLGFGIIGGKSTGVVVKTILPGGVSDRDGRLQSGDHILHIGDVNVRGMASEQVASVLRQSGSHVRLVVARAVAEPSEVQNPTAPIVMTNDLDEHLHRLYMELQLVDRQQEDFEYGIVSEDTKSIPLSAEFSDAQVQEVPLLDESEVEVFEVELGKDARGLGITIAGYLGDTSAGELSGIFVKSVAEGSVAAEEGTIQVNDQIIQVDGQSLEGFDNRQAVEVLRNVNQVVRLTLARYKHGPKYDQLQQYALQGTQMTESPANVQSTISVENDEVTVRLDEIRLMRGDDYSSELQPEVEQAIKAYWQTNVGDDYEIVVAQLSKFREGGGLGISLEGTVDVENGQETRPHHYIRSVLTDGPVGMNGRLQSGDELLEVNGQTLLGLNHVEVVTILKELPQHVRIVCSRRKKAQPPEFSFSQTRDMFFQTPAPFATDASGEENSNPNQGMGLVKAKSEQSLPVTAAESFPLNKVKSRSLEPLAGLAMWSSEPVEILLQKGDKGLGFSILDYQDPINPEETVIIIRSLVPGGVAQLDGRLEPGDRLVYVNDVDLENATLDRAVQALKGTQRGVVHIGVAKPLSLAEIGESSTDDLPVISASTPSPPGSDHETTALSVPDSPPPYPPSPIPSPEAEDDHQSDVGFGEDTVAQLDVEVMDLHMDEQSPQHSNPPSPLPFIPMAGESHN